MPDDNALSVQRPPGRAEGGREMPNFMALPDDEVGPAVVDAWKAQDPIIRRRSAQWRVNKLRRQGVVGARITKDKDQRTWRVWAPPSSTPMLPTMNKAARLCRKIVAQLFADPPVAEATPQTDADEDRAAAELATRVLNDLGTEANLANDQSARLAVDLSCDYGSAFRRFYVDPQALRVPMAVQASPQVEALPLDENGEPVVAAGVTNPETGAAYPPPFVRRYVTEDGTLVDDPQADGVRMTWAPKLRREILTGAHVRPLPATALDVWEAEGVIVGGLRRVRELKAQFPEEFAQLSDEDQAKLTLTLSESEKDLIPTGVKEAELRRAEGDDAYTRVLTLYMLQSPEYEQGAYLIIAGDGVKLFRGPWVDPNTDEGLDLPLDQFKQLDTGLDFWGDGMMTALGVGNELRAVPQGTFLDHQEKLTRRRTFLPTTSTLHPKDLQSPTYTVLPINPGGAPIYEQLPDFPVIAEKMLNMVTAEMDDEAGLPDLAQGVNPPGVTSGLHAQRILEQVQVGFTGIRQNTARGLERGWRIQLQLLKAFFPVPQVVRWLGDDSAWKVREWLGTDFRGTKDVRIQRGSFTGLTPSAKAALAESFFAIRDPQTGQALLTMEELRRVVIGNVGGLIGLQDNPHWQRVRRQLEQWKQGPSERAQTAARALVLSGPRVAQVDANGQPVPPPDPIAQEAAQVLVPVPADDDPEIARVRYFELGRVIASTTFAKFPPAWQQPLAQEYLRMRAAAGVATVAEQQQAAAQAAQQQAAADGERGQAQVQAAQIRAQADLQTEQVRQEGQLAREQVEQEPNIVVSTDIPARTVAE